MLEQFDTVLIDCPPSLGVLTVNGLTAAHEVLIPLQCEALAHRGVGQLLDTMDDVRSYTNPNLGVRGVIATMFDSRTRHGREVIEDAQRRFGLTVLEPPVPKSVRFAEAPGRGISILDHAPARAAPRRTARSPARSTTTRRRSDQPNHSRERLHAGPDPPPRPHDPLGKAALFSDARSPTTVVPGSRADPKGAGAASVLAVGGAPRHARRRLLRLRPAHARHLRGVRGAAPPGVAVDPRRRTHRHWLRCPACHKHTWLRALAQ